jgi:hypothetical protein
MASNNDIVIKITLDDSSYQKKLKSVERVTEEVTDKAANSIEKTTTASEKLANSFRSLGQVANQISKVGLTASFIALSKISIDLDRSIVGISGAIFAAGGALLAFGSLLRSTENEFLRLQGTIAVFTGTALTALSLGIGALFSLVGKFIETVGTRFVTVFQNLTNQFIQADKELLVFSKTINNFNSITSGASGSTEAWTKTVNNLSDSLNFSRIELQRAATEIVAVTSQLGLSRSEMEQLLKISAEYAKVNGKDLFNTTVAFASALNGASQGVVQYGIKLNEASLQQFLYKNGIDRTFQSMSEQQKAQARFNSLVAQYSGIAGVATAVAGTFADQQQRFAVQAERVNTAIGRGASIIENNNILYSAGATALSTLNESLLSGIGFIGSLGARIVQFTGFLLKWAFAIFSVVKAFKILNMILAANITQTAFAKSIPFLNISFNQLAASITRSGVAINSSKNLFIAFGLAIKNQVLPILSEMIFGAAPGAIKFSSIFTLMGKRVVAALSAILLASKSLLVFLAPFLLKLGAVVVVFELFRRSILEVEKRTQAFSSLFKAVLDEIARSSFIFGPLIDALRFVRDIIIDLSSRVFGFFVYAISTALSAVISFITSLNRLRKLFSDEFIFSLEETNARLSSLSDSLKVVGFDFRQLGETSLASMEQVNRAISTVNLSDLQQLRQELNDLTLTDFDRLNVQFDQRIDLLEAALREELILENEFNQLRLIAQQDFNTRWNELRQQEIERNLISNQSLADNTENVLSKLSASVGEQSQRIVVTLGEISRAALAGFANAIGGAFASFGKAIASGENALKAFANSFIQSIGQIAVQTGAMFILQGLGLLFNPLIFDKAGASMLIKQGVALSVFGGALSAVGGGGASTATAGGVGGGGGGNFFEPTMPDVVDPDDFNNQGPQTQITVQIQGDVLDSDETGLRIVDLLSEYVDRNGNGVVLA